MSLLGPRGSYLDRGQCLSSSCLFRRHLGHLLLGSPGVSQPLPDSPTQPFVMGDSDNREVSVSTRRSLPWNGPAHRPDLTDVLACTEAVCSASSSAGCKRIYVHMFTAVNKSKQISSHGCQGDRLSQGLAPPFTLKLDLTASWTRAR